MDTSLVDWKSPRIRTRFLSKVVKTSGCWVWVSELTEKGYGRFDISIDGKTYRIRAHRASVLIFTDITDLGDSHVLHRCDNPSCVNPAHLFIGDNADNTLDMLRKGRHGKSKLSAEDYRAIAQDSGHLQQIAAEYGVDASLISQIKRKAIGSWATKGIPIDIRKSRVSEADGILMANDDRPTSEIAKAFNVVPITVIRMRRKYRQ